MTRQRRPRDGEAGVIRGCCFGVVVLAIVLAASVFIGGRALAAPDLGPLPGGVAHGSSDALIGAVLAGEAATQLVLGTHAVVVISERDLTVVVQAHNPSPQTYRNPQARVRNGDVVVSADTSAGPIGVTAVVSYQLVLDTSQATTRITAQPVAYQVGQLGLPAFIGDWFSPQTTRTVNLTALFASNSALELLSQAVDCLSVQPDGVHVGFHRPGGAASDAACR